MEPLLNTQKSFWGPVEEEEEHSQELWVNFDVDNRSFLEAWRAAHKAHKAHEQFDKVGKSILRPRLEPRSGYEPYEGLGSREHDGE